MLTEIRGIRLTLRSLRRSPLISMVTIATLSLGIRGHHGGTCGRLSTR